jgi:hypoxanthine phosphoribosyltransferase
MSEKYFISAEELLEDSYRLGVQIINSGFRPDFIVGIWRGGTPVGIAIQELMDYFNIPTDHISLRTSLYQGIASTRRKVRVHGLGYLVRNLNAHNALLIVDDVFDSGRSIEAVIQQLTARTRRNTPHQIKVAAPWYKPGNNTTDRVPDFYVHQTDRWLVFPHEVTGLTDKELAAGKAGLFRIMQDIQT